MNILNISQRSIALLTLLTAFSFANGETAKSSNAASPAANRELPRHPNVLFIICDDLRTELGCYGVVYMKTPNIDRFAAKATLFEHQFCSVPNCGPSRVALLTGRAVRKPRWQAYNVRADHAFPNSPTLPLLLKKAGYTTISLEKVFHVEGDSLDSWSERPKRNFYNKAALVRYRNALERFNPKFVKKLAVSDNDPSAKTIAKQMNTRGEFWDALVPVDPASLQHLNARTGRGPFVEHPDVPDDAYSDGIVANMAVSELKKLKQADKPFFFAVGFHHPHLPLYMPERYWDLYPKVPSIPNFFRPKNAPRALRDGGHEVEAYNMLGLKYNSPEFRKLARHGYLASVSYVDALVGKVLTELKRLDLDKNTIVIVCGDNGWNVGEHTFWGKHNLMDNSNRVPLIMRVPGGKPNVVSANVESVDVFPTVCDYAHITVPPKAAANLSGTSLRPLLENPKTHFDHPAYCYFGGGRTVVSGPYEYTEYGKGGTGKRMLYDHQTDPMENNNIAANPEMAPVVAKLHQLLLQGEKHPETKKSQKP